MNSPFAIEYHVQHISMVHNARVFVRHSHLIHDVIQTQVMFSVNKDGLASIVIKVRSISPSLRRVQQLTVSSLSYLSTRLSTRTMSQSTRSMPLSSGMDRQALRSISREEIRIFTNQRTLSNLSERWQMFEIHLSMSIGLSRCLLRRTDLSQWWFKFHGQVSLSTELPR